MKRLILFIFPILILACREEIRTDLENQVLVESFINHGQDENYLSIKLFSPLSKEEDFPFITPQSTRISNISKNVVIFPEFESSGSFILNSDALKLGEEDILELEISFNNRTIFANAIVPKPTRLMALNNEELKLNYVVDAVPNRINLSWEPYGDPDYYIVQIDTASENPDEIDGERIAVDPGDPYFNRVGIPVNASELEISYPAVNYFGRHRVVLFHISKDLYDLYNNPVQGSYNKLNQSVVNGLGIFTALNSDTLYFEVVP